MAPAAILARVVSFSSQPIRPGVFVSRRRLVAWSVLVTVAWVCRSRRDCRPGLHRDLFRALRSPAQLPKKATHSPTVEIGERQRGRGRNIPLRIRPSTVSSGRSPTGSSTSARSAGPSAISCRLSTTTGPPSETPSPPQVVHSRAFIWTKETVSLTSDIRRIVFGGRRCQRQQLGGRTQRERQRRRGAGVSVDSARRADRFMSADAL